MRLCLRTIVLVYVLEVLYLTLLAVDHRQDLRHFRKVVTCMFRELRR